VARSPDAADGRAPGGQSGNVRYEFRTTGDGATSRTSSGVLRRRREPIVETGAGRAAARATGGPSFDDILAGWA
jgi:hypothetical protein